MSCVVETVRPLRPFVEVRRGWVEGDEQAEGSSKISWTSRWVEQLTVGGGRG